MKVTLPNIAAPAVTEKLLFVESWIKFFAALINPPSAIAPITLTGSPFSYQTAEKGTVSIVGGTVSAVAIIRGQTTLSTGLTAGLFPLGLDDTITITYTVAPTVNFIPG